MAADSSSWHGDVWLPVAKKLHRLKDGGIAGVAGWKPVVLAALDWYNAGADPDKRPPAPKDETELDVIILRPDCTLWSLCGDCRLWLCDWPYAIAGSHHEFVLGALMSGLSAIEAVELAVRHCKFARGPVCFMRLE